MTSSDLEELASKDRLCVVGRRLASIVAATAMLASMQSAPAQAQDRAAQERPPRLEAQAGRAVAFDIPVQPLAQALTAFGRQSGLQLAFDPAAAAGKSSVGVSGTMTPEQALRQLLGGSGLTYQFTSTSAVTVSGTAGGSGVMQLDPLRIQGTAVPSQAMIDNLPPVYAGGQVATGGQLGLLGNRGVMDTPFNQTSYTAKKAQDQQAKTVRDVLIDDPSVRGYNSDSGFGSNNLRIRGFTVPIGDTAYGGLYGMLPAFSIMAELAERVEVLKGPSAMLTGIAPAGAIGGTINIVPKRAPDAPLTQLTADYTSSAQFGGAADVARRFGPDGQFGVRFNGVFRAGQTAVEGNSDQKALAVLGLDFRGERVRLSADLGYQYQFVGGAIPYLGLANNVPLPWAPDARKNFGQPWGNLSAKDLFGVVRAEFDLTERITAYAAFGAHDFRLGVLRGGDPVTITNINGNATATPGNLSQYQTNLTGQVGLRALVDTGPIGHEFAFTATTFERTIGSASINTTPYATNIYNPNVIAQPSIPTPAANKASTSI